jgi:hypothetical protein
MIRVSEAVLSSSSTAKTTGFLDGVVGIDATRRPLTTGVYAVSHFGQAGFSTVMS